MPRKTDTREFKLQALKMPADQGLSVAEVARRLGVAEGCLRAWRKAAEEHGDAAFPGHGNPSPAEDELRRLRAEVARLKAERDRLKKAAAYFANPPTRRSGSSPRAAATARSRGPAMPWTCPRPGTTPGRPAPRPRARNGGPSWWRRPR